MEENSIIYVLTDENSSRETEYTYIGFKTPIYEMKSMKGTIKFLYNWMN